MAGVERFELPTRADLLVLAESAAPPIGSTTAKTQTTNMKKPRSFERGF